MTHLEFVRQQGCLVKGCHYPAQAHHVRSAASSGIGIKPDDRWAVPLCQFHHSQGHTSGWRTFERNHRLDLAAEAVFLWSVSNKPMP